MNSYGVNNIFSIYEYLKDSIKVTRRTIIKSKGNLHNRTVFFAEKPDSTLKKMNFVEDEIEDIIILSLFASFERELRISIQTIFENNFTKISNTHKKICSIAIKDIERWPVNDMVDLLDDIVDVNLRGRVKQIYEYRNWVAHGKNINKVPSIKTDPRTVYTVLSDFINQATNVI